MNPDTRKKIMLGVLMAVAVGVVGYQLMKGTGAPPATPKTTTAKNAPAAKPGAKPAPGRAAAGAAATAGEAPIDVDIDALIREIEPVNFDYQTQHIERDPTTPLVGVLPTQTSASSPLRPKFVDVTSKKVTGIIFDPANPAAVVDDEVVAEGHTYADGTIVQEIDRDRVVFKVGDSLIPVELTKLGMSY